MGSRVHDFVQTLHVGEPVASDGIRFYPLLRDGDGHAPVVLLDDAIALGQLEVRETGKVNELEAVNRADASVLLLEGDIVEGGRQNRAINTTCVIRGRTTARVPTSCVERGRWEGREATFTQSGYMVSPLVKSALKRTVHDTIRMTRGASRTSDQSTVWQRTTDSLEASQAISHTEDHLEAYRKSAADLDQRVRGVCDALAKAGRVAGVAIVRADGRAAVEAFASTSIAAKVLPRVVRAHLLVPAKGATEEAPSRLLDEVVNAHETSVPGAGGVGEEVRLQKSRMSGLAFLLDACTLHLSADWADEDEVHSQNSVILRRPPS